MLKSDNQLGTVFMYMQSKSNKPLVISYLRWSSGKQKLGDSERRQMNQANSWLKKNGYELNESYVLRDDGKSAYHSENFGENGALGKFVRQAESGEIPRGTILIIEDFSRFSRSHVRKALKHFLGLLDAGIRIYVAKDDMEFNDQNADEIKIIITLSKMAAAYEESHRKSNHLKSFWEGARTKAGSNTESNEYPVLLPSNAPDWLKKIKGKDGQKYFAVIPDRIEVIKRIFELADIGGEDGLGLGSTMIVRVLESEGVKPFKGERGNTAKTFNDSYVLRLLKDQRLLGYLQPFINPVDEKTGKRKRTAIGEPIPNYFPPLIDQKLFDRVNFKIQQRKIYQGGKVSRKFTNLFTKIGKCSYCGSSMTLFTKRGSKAEGGRSAYLQCSEGTKLRKCGNRAVRYFDTFEKTIIMTLVELDLSSLFQKNSNVDNQKIIEKRNEIYEIENEQKKIERKMYVATDKLLEDPSDKDIVKRRAELKNQRGILASKLESLKDELMSVSRKSNYQEFKDNLEIVINSFSEEDDIATYNKRRAINTYLIDIVQYIAIDGVNQSCWIVFDLGFLKEKYKGSILEGQDFMAKKNALGESFDTNIPNNKEVIAFGFSPISAHLKVKLNRFNNRPPTKDDVLNLRESIEIAPKELIEINETINSAINKNWQSLKRKSYQVLCLDLENKIKDEAYFEMVSQSDNSGN